MAVHFKFRSAVDYDSINLDDLFISVRNLKQRIVEHKNLASNRTIDFDLVITDSQTGEEYRDENYLVPRNTSVIIKRVPAVRSKTSIQASDPPKPTPKPNYAAPGPPRLASKAETEGDDFGVDLFAAPAPVPSKAEEDAKIMEMLSKSSLEWQRSDPVPQRGGRGRGRGGGPPAGYVCHRCGQPGHFIQQCPTNGDPNYDIKKVRLPVGIPRTRLRIDQEGSYVLPDGSVAAMQPDENLFAKEADALLSVKSTTEAPSELRCPLCRSTFKEAVMIPCCHYSFCDKCIRQNLITKGQCPQCGSMRFKNDDLLPNIALRQAIEKFLNSQMNTNTTEQGAVVPDGDSAAQHSNAPSQSKHSAEDNVEAGKLRDASSGLVIAESSVASKTDANLHPVIPKDASGSVNQEGNEPVRDIGDGGKTSEPLIHKGADEIALESEVSKGKKKKKRARGVNSVDAGTMEGAAVGKGERFCYQCGSPGHLAKDCIENMGSYPPHPGMFASGGAFPVGPYGPDMFWHGPPVPPFAPGYDGLYGPGLGGMPPMPPPGAFQMPPCMPPPYPNVPPVSWFGDHGMMSGAEMPLSREEFLKLQEEEHNRRAMNDHRGEWSQSTSQRRTPPHGRASETRERHSNLERHQKSDHDSTGNYSERFKQHSLDKYKERPTFPTDDSASRRKSERERRSMSSERNGGNHRDEYRHEKVTARDGAYYKDRHSRDKANASVDHDGRDLQRRPDIHNQREERRSKFSSRPEEADGVGRGDKDKRADHHGKPDREGKLDRENHHHRQPDRDDHLHGRPDREDHHHDKLSREDHTPRSRHYADREREHGYNSDDAKRKRRRSREVEEERSRAHSSKADHSYRYSMASEDHSRWRPDHYEDDDRYRDDRKHRHHHRR